MDDRSVKFSIIVPIYKVEKYLEKCINSIINQTYKNIEIILVNDGSPDSCDVICKKYEALDERIKYFEKENGGLSSARNFGMQHMTGDYVWFVDSDDYIATDAVEVLVDYLSNHDVDILAFNYFSVKNGVINKMRLRYKDYDIDKCRKYIIDFPMACLKIYKSKLFIDNNLKFKEGIIYEDLALIPCLVNYTKNIDFIDNYIYYYLIREDSIMRKTNFSAKVDDKFIAIECMYNMFEASNNIDIYKDEIEFLYVKHLLIVFSIEIMKYGRKVFKPRLCKSLDLISKKFPKYTNNKYIKMEPIFTRIYIKLLKYRLFTLAHFINYIARIIFDQ